MSAETEIVPNTEDDNQQISGTKRKRKEPRTVEVYYTDHGTEMFELDGWLVERDRTTDAECLNPSPLDHYRPYKSGFKKIETSRPPSGPRPWYLDEKYKVAAREQTVDIAEAALKHYNKTYHVDYVLVDPVGSNGSNDSDGLWFHCNFTAKPREAPAAGNGDLLTELFFAEQKKAGQDRSLSITTCCILKGDKITDGCGMCPKLSHPSRGFRRGMYPNESRVLRSVTRGIAR